MSDGYATERDLNGLGERVNKLAVDCAGCKSARETNEKNTHDRQESQSSDIRKLFDKMDDVKDDMSQEISNVKDSLSKDIKDMEKKRADDSAKLNKGVGILAAVAFIVPIVITIIIKIWN